MKKLLFIGLLFWHALSYAQRHEIGLKIGTSNIVGDIGKTNFLQIPPDTGASIGFSYKRNFNPYQGVKLSINYNYAKFNDNKAKELYRHLRQSLGSNDILEGSLTFEYNFFPINDEIRNTAWSPYIFAGVSGLWYDSPSYNITIQKTNSPLPEEKYAITSEYQSTSKRISMGIPFGIGLKYKFNYNWAVYGELTFRPTLTDDLDYNNIANMEYTINYSGIPETDLPAANKALDQFIDSNKIGNLNSKDWLNSISFGVSYSFGRPPCYCN